MSTHFNQKSDNTESTTQNMMKSASAATLIVSTCPHAILDYSNAVFCSLSMLVQMTSVDELGYRWIKCRGQWFRIDSHSDLGDSNKLAFNPFQQMMLKIKDGELLLSTYDFDLQPDLSEVSEAVCVHITVKQQRTQNTQLKNQTLRLWTEKDRSAVDYYIRFLFRGYIVSTDQYFLFDIQGYIVVVKIEAVQAAALASGKVATVGKITNNSFFDVNYDWTVYPESSKSVQVVPQSEKASQQNLPNRVTLKRNSTQQHPATTGLTNKRTSSTPIVDDDADWREDDLLTEDFDSMSVTSYYAQHQQQETLSLIHISEPT